MAKKFLRLPAVVEATGLSKSSIYLKIKNREFPAQITLGSRTVVWVENEVQEWIEKQIHNRSQKK